MAACSQGRVCTAHWEGAQAPIVHVLICYCLLRCQMNTSYLFLKEQSSAEDSVTFTEKNTCKSLTFLTTSEKLIQNKTQKGKRGVKRKVWKKINVVGETKREKNKKDINFSNYRSFTPVNVTHLYQSCKANSFFADTGYTFSCPVVAIWLLNMRTRQNMKLQLKIRINLIMASRDINICS